MILIAALRIPSIDLSGDAASRRQAVQLYKKEVTSWLRAQGHDPAKYTIHWSHNDDGSLATSSGGPQ